ncbi:hypothetical protein [Streptomyces gibsoniae]|uniref:Uncharacterized protein n=1 Tax=Streptomyces gibsoniae TaxID=3075529 RepID=A0ABU2TSK7_9ACTN|nr:hypothetical protein [Streptomyces sp. DSM 41699]MDT0463939.1 hypothetical protein [Streptomyces sp. DSM 41699]
MNRYPAQPNWRRTLAELMATVARSATLGLRTVTTCAPNLKSDCKGAREGGDHRGGLQPYGRRRNGYRQNYYAT